MADVDGRIRLRRRRYNAQQLHKARPTNSIECASVEWPRLIHIEMLEEFVVPVALSFGPVRDRDTCSMLSGSFEAVKEELALRKTFVDLRTH